MSPLLLDDLIVSGIKSSSIGDVWADLWPLLAPAAALAGEKIDYLAGIRARDLQCWAIFEKIRPVAGIVTRIFRDTTSGELICQIHLVGGSRLLEWAADFLDKLTKWAREEGCTWLEAAGRKGWSRIAPRLGFARSYEHDGDLYWRRAV